MKCYINKNWIELNWICFCLKKKPSLDKNADLWFSLVISFLWQIQTINGKRRYVHCRKMVCHWKVVTYYPSSGFRAISNHLPDLLRIFRKHLKKKDKRIRWGLLNNNTMSLQSTITSIYQNWRPKFKISQQQLRNFKIRIDQDQKLALVALLVSRQTFFIIIDVMSAKPSSELATDFLRHS